MTQKLISVLNCGSSSLKGAAIDNDSGEVLLSCLTEKLNLPNASITLRANGEKHKVDLSTKPNHADTMEVLMEELKAHDLDSKIGVIGHCIVSGGELYSEPTPVDDEMIASIEKCIPPAPLHSPIHLFGLRTAQSIFKDLPNVVVFNTALHQSMPKHAYIHAIPQELYHKYDLRCCGAHGTSHRFVADETARLLGKDKEDLRMVAAHLGNGASISAVAGGERQDISIGLTPLEGLVMGTRSGDIDPTVFDFLVENANMTIAQITGTLSKKSGLLGLSGLSNDCRTIEEETVKGHEGAILAMGMFIYRLAKCVGSMAVAADGLGVLVFTGGISENSELIRSKVLGYLDFLGLTEDHETSLRVHLGNTGVITTTDSKVIAVVIPTNEGLMITHDTAHLSDL